MKNHAIVLLECQRCEKYFSLLLSCDMLPTYDVMYETRQDMVKSLALNGVVAEIGVFRGEFANELLTLCPNIQHLHLVDIWSPGAMMSGNQDGNNVQVYDGVENLKHVSALFAGNEKVTLHHMWSHQYFAITPDASLDSVYIDGDHGYDGCLADLRAARAKVKKGGWIMGHDVAINPHKCQHIYNFGVGRAVATFLAENNLKVHVVANDGCMSFAIKND